MSEELAIDCGCSRVINNDDSIHVAVCRLAVGLLGNIGMARGLYCDPYTRFFTHFDCGGCRSNGQVHAYKWKRPRLGGLLVYLGR